MLLSSNQRIHLITTVDEVNVATPALHAIVKLETLAVRGNAIELPNDSADLIWCLKEVKKKGFVIPEEALVAGFNPAGWGKMYTRLRKIVDDEQVWQLRTLLRHVGLKPEVPEL